MESSDQYKFTFIKYQGKDDHISYLIKVFAPGGITFTIQDRYSSMKKFQDDILSSVRVNKDLPSFPKKKLFGNKKEEFLRKRQRELESYFNALFSIREVAQHSKSL